MVSLGEVWYDVEYLLAYWDKSRRILEECHCTSVLNLLNVTLTSFVLPGKWIQENYIVTLLVQ